MIQSLTILKSLGYQVEIIGENIKITYTGKGEIDKDKVLPLIEELKAHKEEAIEELKRESFESLFKETLVEIDKQYMPGTIAYVTRHHTNLYRRIRQAEDKLNKIWIKGINFDEFKEALRVWYLLHIEGIEIYKRRAN